MKKLSFEEKKARRRRRAQARLDAKPVLGMAHYEMKDIATVKLQIIKLTRTSVMMKTIGGKGTITISTKNGMDITEFMKIEMLPCSIVPTLTRNGETVEIPQGTECCL